MIKNELIANLGLTLLHSLWQITLIGLVFALACRLFRRPSAQHLLGIVALITALVWPTLGLVERLDGKPTPVPANPAPFTTEDAFVVDGGSAAHASALEATVYPSQLADLAHTASPFLAVLWLLGVAWTSLRFAAGHWQLDRLRALATVGEAQSQLATVLGPLRLRMGVAEQRLRLLVTDDPRVAALAPCTFGLLRTTLVVPSTVLTGLPAAHLDAVLLHELAHIRRRDAWFATVQAIADCLLFFHPVARWISAHTTRARERACDDLVIASGEDRRHYAQALLGLARLNANAPAFALAANSSELRGRIQRLLSRSDQASLGPAAAILAIAAIILGGVISLTPRPPVSAQEQPPNVEQIMISAEIVEFDPSVRELGLDGGRDPLTIEPHRLVHHAVLQGETSSLVRSTITQRISRPRIVTLAGSTATMMTGLGEEVRTWFPETFQDIARGRLEIEIGPTHATANMVIANLKVVLQPGWANEAVSSTVLLDSRNQAFERGRQVLFLQNATSRSLLGLILHFERAGARNANIEGVDQPVTLTVKDAHLEELLITLIGFADLEVVYSERALPLLAQEVTVQAHSAPVRQLIDAILRINCLQAAWGNATLEIDSAPGCSA